MRVELRGPGDQYRILDTPDPALIGPWLHAIVDSFQLQADRPYPFPVEFWVRVS
jgi:hypothetical protein